MTGKHGKGGEDTLPPPAHGADSGEPEWSIHLPAGVNPDEVDLLSGGSLPSVWRRKWSEEPEARAIIDLTGAEEHVLKRGDLLRRTQQLAAVLADRGVKRDDRVLFSAGPSVEYLLLYLAAMRLGAIIVPANTGYRSRELGFICSDSEPVLAVIDDGERARWVEVPVLDPRDVPATCTHAEAPHLDGSSASEVAMIAYTSGTTGRPKGAMLTHANLLASAEALRLAWRWGPDDGLVLALPLFHLHGLGVGVHGSLCAGGRILLTGAFDPRRVVAASRRDDATMFFGVPTMYRRLVEFAESEPKAGESLRSLRLLVSGSAPLSSELWERVRALTGHAIIERYGMTETVMLVSNPYDGERRPGTVGFALPGVEVRLEGDGSEGEIQVRGPNVFSGYHGNEQATEEAFTAGGFFRTGDVGSRSEDGYLSIVGRSKELIISGGYNIYPREVEEVLEEHAAVGEAAVCGAPSAEWGEEVVALVVPADRDNAVDSGRLIAHCAARLASYKKPRRVVIVDALPRNAMGKLSRQELSALVE